MDTLSAFARGQAAQGNRIRSFDWDKAARLIAERKPETAGAGLSGDWEWTGGAIFDEGAPVSDDYTYLASTWAIPELSLDGDLIDCWRYEDETGWSADTKWPESALALLGIIDAEVVETPELGTGS